MKKKNKVMVGALALLVMGTSSLAYFTDRTESTFNAKAGNLCLTHVDSDSDLLNMSPGDLRDISFEYKNEGSLAMDTRVTYMLSYELEDGKAGATEGKVVTLLDGDKELVTKEVGEGVAKVTVNETTIQGTADKAGEASLKKNLKLKLHESVANDFQDATFHIDIVVEGKQNKNDAQWEEINTEKISVRADELNVVRQSACNVGDDVVESILFDFSEEARERAMESELQFKITTSSGTQVYRGYSYGKVANMTIEELKELVADALSDSHEGDDEQTFAIQLLAVETDYVITGDETTVSQIERRHEEGKSIYKFDSAYLDSDEPDEDE